MGVDRTQDRARPKQRIRAWPVRPFDRDRAGDIDHDLGLGAKAGKLGQTIDFRKGDQLQSQRDNGHAFVELMQGHRLGLAPVAQASAFGAGDVERIGYAAEAPRGIEGTIPPGFAGIGERDQMSREIAAVDRRYVSRFERPKIARVVPVEEVAAQMLHAIHCRQRRLEAIDRLPRSDPPEFPR